jgi:ABC-type polar amino acid transport system ATPase subunit
VAKARELMALFGLGDKENSYPGNSCLEGCNSVWLSPELWRWILGDLFDEPTSALDPR